MTLATLTRRALIAATALALALPAAALAQTVRFSTAGPAGYFLYRGMERFAQAPRRCSGRAPRFPPSSAAIWK